MAVNKHISEQFDLELDKVRRHFMEMGGLVERQVQAACEALVTHDGELAQQVTAADRKVNTMELQIDEQCTQIIAKRQPTASDLRLVISVIKTITDLERMGDEAERIARQAAALKDVEYPDNQYNAFRHLAGLVHSNVTASLDAFARNDVRAASNAIRADNLIDQEYKAIIEHHMAAMADAESVQQSMATVWAARSLERIGDHAKNICEYVVYQVRGTDVRHKGLDALQPDA